MDLVDDILDIPSKSLNNGKLVVFDCYEHQRFVKESSSKNVYHGQFQQLRVDPDLCYAIMSSQWEVRKRVAVKRRQILNVDDIDAELVESNFLLQLTDHPNILKYYFTYKDDSSSIPAFLFIVTELCTGTLEDLIEGTYQEEHPSSRIGDDKRHILLQITRAVVYLHEKRIVHRDIKPDNIFITEEYGSHVRPRMKLADFDISCRFDKPNYTSGTRGWMAPEFYSSKNCDAKGDTFALGLVFGYTLCGGRHPFDQADVHPSVKASRRQMNIKIGKITLTNETMEEQYRGDDALQLMKSMLNENPEDRMASQDILRHPFFLLIH